MHYAGIIGNDVVNGQDVCVSFWCQGCPIRCDGCQNKHTWDYDGGIEEDEDVLIDIVLDLIIRNGVQRNFSILGGEPLCKQNIEFVAKILKRVKMVYPSIKTFVWTGYRFEDIYVKNHDVLSYIDVLIDGPYDNTKRDITLPLRGSTNQRVLELT